MDATRHFFQIMAMAATAAVLLATSYSTYGIGDGGSLRPAPWVGNNFWGEPCSGSRIPFGPYDYTERARFRSELFVVEEYHLTDRIKNLQQDTTTSAINDIQYTLMAWPNHHVALHSAIRYRKINRGKWPQNTGSATPVECHLQRAINFSPRDPIPYMLQGLLLHEFELYEEALKSFRMANKLMPNDVITLYNMGLTLVVLEMYEEASQVAAAVYNTDFPLPGLRNQLITAGYWQAGVGPVTPPEQPELDTEPADNEATPAESSTPEGSVSMVDQ